MKKNISWDAIGIGASLACAIHCAALPLLVTSLPIFGIDIIDNKYFEFMMIGIAFVIGFLTLRHGKKRHHHNILPLQIFSVGIVGLIAKEIWHTYALVFLIPAVGLIISAHFLNHILCKNHYCNSKSHCKH